MEREKIIGQIEISEKRLSEIKKEVKNILGLKKKIEEFFTASITELISIILVGAIFLDSSDIHIEPEEKQSKLRIRIDGKYHYRN